MKKEVSLAATLGIAVLSQTAFADPFWSDTFRDRLEAWALIQTLNATLLASDSATKTLEAWCGAHHMAAGAVVHAKLRRDVHKPISPAQRARLNIWPDEPVVYRRVDLVCGDHILSQADNWYVPRRLTPAMEKALETSDIPFGRAIESLHPFRRTFAVNIVWHPLPEGWEFNPPGDHPGAPLSIPPVLFEHHALVYSGDGQPISQVDEYYTRGILDFHRAK